MAYIVVTRTPGGNFSELRPGIWDGRRPVDSDVVWVGLAEESPHQTVVDKEVHTVHLDVTAQDLQEGKRQSTAACPIAIALLRTGFAVGFVGHDDVEVRLGHRRFHAALPSVARNFVELYDETDDHVGSRPFTTTLHFEEGPYAQRA